MMLWSVLLLSALLVFESSVLDEKNRMVDSVEGMRCLTGWYLYSPSKHCYRYFPKRLSWQHAEAECSKLVQGGHLASIHFQHQNDFIHTLVRQGAKRDRPIWIGLNDRKSETMFQWSDMSRYLFHFLLNDSKDPASTTNCDTFCNKSKKWKDLNCEKKLRYICSYKSQT
uniref:C-type lectin domain-containing protein n=1 Tax=Callorhinchus milii TaxID=7868 RepID=A0A4W3GI81_CALMI